MSDNVENLILEQTKGIGDTLDTFEKRFDSVDRQLDGLDTRVNGINVMMATVIGESHSLDGRVEAPEGKRK